MLFRPRRPVKLLGLTVFPQGMIPRHRERLAQTIGNAVGNELVSQDTVVHALFETGFFRRKVESFIEGYTRDLLSTARPSFLESLPASVRPHVLDAITNLQMRVGTHLAEVLRSEETAATVHGFINRRVDEILARHLEDAVDEETFAQAIDFVERRFHALVSEKDFGNKVRAFISARVDDLMHSQATLAEMFTPDAVAILKARIDAQVPPIVQHIAELATSDQTRTQIGALIKREVDEYYTQLNFFKKIFVSRERIHHEVDEMVEHTLPRRVEDFLRGESFALEAENFINGTIDNVLARPMSDIVGQIAPDKLDSLKEQIAARIITLAQSPELGLTISNYTSDAIARLRPHSLRALLEHASPDSTERLKSFLSKGLLSMLASDETARTINAILSQQIERLLIAPIGRLSDHFSEGTIERAADALSERITQAARERLPTAIAEFDIGGIVRQKVSQYPEEKLEELVLSVAKQHLRKIELFGLFIGLLIGIIQAAMFLWMR